MAVAIARPQRRRHIPETFLLLATGLVLVVGSAATSEFVLRYLVPAAPFLLAAGALATTNFTHRRPHTRQDADRRVRFDRRVR